jgi:hypothetical protein
MLQYEVKKTHGLNGVRRRRGGTCKANVGTRRASLIVLTFAETSSWRQKLFVRSAKVHTKSSCE